MPCIDQHVDQAVEEALPGALLPHITSLRQLAAKVSPQLSTAFLLLKLKKSYNLHCDDGAVRHYEVVPFNNGTLPTDDPVSTQYLLFDFILALKSKCQTESTAFPSLIVYRGAHRTVSVISRVCTVVLRLRCSRSRSRR